MGAKEIRMARLLNPETGKAVNIPVDHGSVMGCAPGLTDPVAVLEKLIGLGIDSTLLNPGLVKITEHLFENKMAPGRVLTADLPLMSTCPGESDVVMGHEQVASVEAAVRLGVDCMKVLLVWGIDPIIQMHSLKFIAQMAEECDRWEMPLMVEPVFWGPNIPVERRTSPEMIENGARIALEIGADILKMNYSGDLAEFKDLVRRMKVPVMVLGGPKSSSLRDVFVVARESIDAGAVAIVFGRNVWQNPRMEDVVRTLQDIVHKDMGVDKAMKNHGL
jgi:fructose-bisphosphate aldolase, class I